MIRKRFSTILPILIACMALVFSSCESEDDSTAAVTPEYMKYPYVLLANTDANQIITSFEFGDMDGDYTDWSGDLLEYLFGIDQLNYDEYIWFAFEEPVTLLDFSIGHENLSGSISGFSFIHNKSISAGQILVLEYNSISTTETIEDASKYQELLDMSGGSSSMKNISSSGIASKIIGSGGGSFNK